MWCSRETQISPFFSFFHFLLGIKPPNSFGRSTPVFWPIEKILEISGAWAQWRATKGEVVSIPSPPEPKIKSSSKAHNKKEDESTDESSKNKN